MYIGNSSCLSQLLFLFTIFYCFERMFCMEWTCFVPVFSWLWFNMKQAKEHVCVCMWDIIFCTVYFWPDLSSCSRACLLHAILWLNNLGRRLNSLPSKCACLEQSDLQDFIANVHVWYKLACQTSWFANYIDVSNLFDWGRQFLVKKTYV